VRILDFGLAGFATEAAAAEVADGNASTIDPVPRHLTTIGCVMGTPDYISPEQARDAHTADIRSDIYSLGCTLHYLLTGKPPFEADSVLDKLKAHLDQTPPSLDELDDEVSPELAAIVARMLAKDPEERFQTPADVAAALAPFAAEAQPVAKRPNDRPWSRLTKWMLVPLLVFAAVIVYLATDTGLVTIDAKGIDVPGAKVVLLKDGKEYASFDVKATQEFQRVRAGKYEVQLRKAGDDVQMNVWFKRGNSNNWGKEVQQEVEPVVLYRGGDMLIRVLRKDKLEVAESNDVQDFQDFVGVTAYLNDPRNNRGGSVPVALLGREGRVAFRFGNWLVVFDGIVCDPKATILGFSSFNIPHRGSSGEGTIDFGARDKLPGVLIKFKFANEQNEISINNHRFKLRGKAAKLEFDDHAYDATNAMQTILVARDGSTRLAAIEKPAPQPGTEQKDVIDAAEEFLAALDEDDPELGHSRLSAFVRRSVGRAQFVAGHKANVARYGSLKDRKLVTAFAVVPAPGLPPGRYFAVQFRSTFENAADQTETVMLNLDEDGTWRANAHAISPAPPPLTPLIEPNVNKDGSTDVPAAPARRKGLLTNPPVVPPGGLPVGKNLIVDPSLEKTPTGQVPDGWFAWLNDGPDFKCEVVEGGVTGKRCLQISGTGTRGVVFATSIPLDRTKRYALKGRVKVEGEAGTWAVIKLNYFNKTGWLGADDRIGVTSSDPNWKLLEKTDQADKYPAATLIVPTCHIEGNGTAWFDDLEVIAYDKEALPDEFDARHGRNNRMK
jgi:hypothetical protein